MNEPTAIPLTDSPYALAHVRLAQSEDEIRQAQHLRYCVFYEEYGAIPSKEMEKERRDFDGFDAIADHLIVIATNPDTQTESIVGTYRLLRQEIAEKYGRFYSADEYDLTKLLDSRLSLLELGRSCVLAEYRTKPILNMLWQGIARYINDYKIDLLFGCASFQGTDIKSLASQLSYLHHFHPTPESMRPKALDSRFVDMNMVAKEDLDARAVFASLPPLIKGYLRVGATIGEGAVIDEQFNTTDVCIVVQTSAVTNRYRKHYERKLQTAMHGQEIDMDMEPDSDSE